MKGDFRLCNICDCKQKDIVSKYSDKQDLNDCGALVFSMILPKDHSKTRHEKLHNINIQFAPKNVADGMFFHSQCYHNIGRLYAFFELKNGKWEKIKTNV